MGGRDCSFSLDKAVYGSRLAAMADMMTSDSRVARSESAVGETRSWAVVWTGEGLERVYAEYPRRMAMETRETRMSAGAAF